MSYLSYSRTTNNKVWPGPDRPAFKLPVVGAASEPYADDTYLSAIPSQLVIPNKPDVNFHRGNFCCRAPLGCITPYTPGVPILTWDLVRMAKEDQQKFVDHYVSDLSFTHIDLSIPQTRNFGLTIKELEYTVDLCKSYNLFVLMNCFGGDGEIFDSDIKPWLDQLGNKLSVLVTAWQIDKYYGGDLVDRCLDVINYAKPRGLLNGPHWLNEACAFWPYPQYGIANRFDYANFMIGKQDFQYWQTNTEASVNAIQWSLITVLHAYNTDAHSKLVATEYDSQAEFDNPSERTEVQGATKGYVMMCALYNNSMPVRGGFMGDAYYPHGKVL